MKRTVIFAHYDRDNIVDDYVILYLLELAKVCDRIIFVSDSDLSAKEIRRVEAIADLVIAGRHGEYDFGSWKKGLIAIEHELANIDELVLANDSCYCINSFEPVFEKMKNNNCDFWGLVHSLNSVNPNSLPIRHLQSYFLVFRKNMFMSKEFVDYFKAVKAQPTKNAIIEEYELRFTRHFENLGFKADNFIKRVFVGNPTCSEVFFKELVPAGFPVMKVSLLKENHNVCELIKWRKLVGTVEKETITKHISRFISDFKHWNLKPDIIFLHKKIFYLQRLKKETRIKIFGIRIFKFKR